MEQSAQAALDCIAAAYSDLKTLSCDIIHTTETSGEGERHSGEKRGRAYYAAPDRVRVEQGLRDGMTLVLNGDLLHVYFARPGQYARDSIAGQPQRRPGMFEPEFAGGSLGQVFLFHRIAERVASAAWVEADGGWAIRVSHDEHSHPNAPVTFSPLLFWMNPDTHLVTRMACTATFRRPHSDEVHISRQTVSFEGVRMNEPVAPGTFDFSPPADAVPMPSGFMSGIGVGGRGGGGGGRGHSRSTRWENGVHIETSQLDFEGVTVTINRRMALSADRRELIVSDEITGPLGVTRREARVPLR